MRLVLVLLVAIGFSTIAPTLLASFGFSTSIVADAQSKPAPDGEPPTPKGPTGPDGGDKGPKKP